MISLTGLLLKWPLVRQLRDGKDGTGLESMSDTTRNLRAKIDHAQIARSICPYCGVGCAQLIYHKDGKLISIEGDPESPLSGPLALLLRAFGFIPMAAVSFLLGALLSRFGWVAAGKVCACDAEAVLAAQR